MIPSAKFKLSLSLAQVFHWLRLCGINAIYYIYIYNNHMLYILCV